MATRLIKTQGTATSTKKFTFSSWVKKVSNTTDHDQVIYGSYNDGNNRITLYFTSNSLALYTAVSGSTIASFTTNRKFRDVSAWYHIVLAVDTTESTSSDRVKLYINGAQETSFSASSYPSQDAVLPTGTSSYQHALGYYSGGGSSAFLGYLSHPAYVDGTALTPTSFGTANSTTGQWQFKTPGGITWGNNGFHLKFENSGNIGLDSSGQGNNFTTSTGTPLQSIDTPTNVYAIWNYSWSASNGNVGDVAFSNGGLTTTTSANYRTTPATLGIKTGKYYWEIKRIEDDGADLHAGVMSENATPANTATWIGNAANGWVISGDAGQPYNGGTGGSAISNAAFPNANDIHMCAYDGSTGKLYFGANGTWGGTANPSTGANPHYTLDTSLVYFPCVSTGSDCSANFGNGFFGTTAVSSAGSNGNGSIFEYDVPSGFYALNTKNINTYG